MPTAPPRARRARWWRPLWVAFRWLGNLIWVVVAVGALVLLFSARTSPDGNPNLFGVRMLVVLSGSMAPTFVVGDMVAVSPVKDPKHVAVGEIVTFSDPQRRSFVTHRIIERRETAVQVIYRTQGDANNAADEKWVLPGQILGRVVAVLPRLGYLVRFARTPLGFIALVLLPGLLLIAAELCYLWRLMDMPNATPAQSGPAENPPAGDADERTGSQRE